MGRIIKPFSMRMAMNSIKANVESYSSQYSEAKATLARYSNDLTGIKGMTANAIFNQLSCYQSLMDMFILVADNMSDDCDAMIDCIGYEEFIEDDIKDTIKEQENIIEKCDERIKHYENLRRELAPYSVFADQCTRQINFNINCKGIADGVIKKKNKELEKLDEIDSSTKDLFVAEKATLDQISKCIAELKTSGQNGFTLQSLPAWATAMQNVLIKKYTDDMLNGDGRLNKDFVEKFADLTVAEMTPAEVAAYNAYVEFLMSDDVTPEDMNLVIECLHSPEHEISAYELALVIDAKTKERCLKSPEPVDSFFLERSIIMILALTTRDVSEPGKISLVEDRLWTGETVENYKYEYKKYIRPDYHTTYKESYRTLLSYITPEEGAKQLWKEKIEHLKRKLRVDEEDYGKILAKLGIDGMMTIFLPPTKGAKLFQIGYNAAREAIETANSPGEDEDFGVTSEGLDYMAPALDVRIIIARPGTEDGALFYDVYPTNKTEGKLDFYNEVFDQYDIEPITLEDIYNDPEAVERKFRRLNHQMTVDEEGIVAKDDQKIGPTGPYIYELPNDDKTYNDVAALEEAYNLWALENGRN